MPVYRGSFSFLLHIFNCPRTAAAPKGPPLLFVKLLALLHALASSVRTAAFRPRFPGTVRPLARDLLVLIGWPFPLGFDLDGRLLLARRGRVYV